MTEEITFAYKLSEYELRAFFEWAAKADHAMGELECMARGTGAEVSLKAARKSVAVLAGIAMRENSMRCRGEVQHHV